MREEWVQSLAPMHLGEQQPEGGVATFLILAQDASGDDRHSITYMVRCMHSKALVTLRVSGGEAHVRRLASPGADCCTSLPWGLGQGTRYAP